VVVNLGFRLRSYFCRANSDDPEAPPLVFVIVINSESESLTTSFLPSGSREVEPVVKISEVARTCAFSLAVLKIIRNKIILVNLVFTSY